ncbi:hypothetical protein HCU74_00330 [Spongiibacter sp. KMU-166]|uniref:Acyl-CoA dehydrogenase n=1 Tax=Spongiibacter thalassae TaxID=2721624 RepID=A0ABX1GA77_9GAMM|nr:acyl-CoA dehydrogenase family protein [Spongiibacter thalassae]NKI15855.1 hypothetical protein [Spongiibacter thalassae]
MSKLPPDILAQLAESAQKFISNEYSFTHRQALASSTIGYSEKHWQMFADLAWLAIPFNEEHGGLGGNIADISGLLEQFGYGLIIEPYISTVVLAGHVLSNANDSPLSQELTAQIISGNVHISLAWQERQSSANVMNIKTTATETEDGYLINGEKISVLNGLNADSYIISAQSQNTKTPSLFFVAADTKGLSAQHHQLYDGHRATTLQLQNVLIPKQNQLVVNAEELLKETMTVGMYALCCEALGSMEKLLEMTIEYAKIRKQFGVPIASFQALRHMISDMYVTLKKTRCLNEQIASQWVHHSPSPQDIAALKVQTGKAAHFISRNAIQIHGGIGMTNELEVGHYVKRLTTIDGLLGNSQYHLASLANSL